jgi:uncharacterized protein (DUF58 family)
LGTGLEFGDHREYTPGDDVRHLDWNVVARHDALVLKRFQEDEDLHVYILVDCSRSMQFGDPPKFDQARRIAAAMAYVALAGLDRVAVLAFADSVFAEFPLTRGKARIVALMRFLEVLSASGAETNLARVAEAFVRRRPRRGLAVVISDLFDPGGYRGGLDLLRHHGYEPTVVQLHDPREANPDLFGEVELFDLESAASKRVSISETALQTYRQAFGEFLASLRTYCDSAGIGCSIAATDVPCDELLQMIHRAGVMR